MNPNIGPDKFEKQYAYNIRHNYGQVGKRADYTPYSCMKIISMNVGPNEHHGCPFKHFDMSHLKLSLEGQGVNSSGVNEIVNLVVGQHYQIACRRHFELLHPDYSNQIVVSHPNQYYDESRKYYKEKNKNGANNNNNANNAFKQMMAQKQ